MSLVTRCAMLVVRRSMTGEARNGQVPLSEDEERILSEIEDLLTETDPDLVREVSETKDRKSTRLNSSHKPTSYAVFSLKKHTPS